MAFLGNLGLRTIQLPPCEEVVVSGPGFDLLMLASGCAYWLEGKQGIALEPNQLLVVERAGGGCLRGAKFEWATVNSVTIRLEWLQGIISFDEQLQIRTSLRALSLPALVPREHPAAVAFRSQVDKAEVGDLLARADSLRILALLVRGAQRTRSGEGGDAGGRSWSCEEKIERFIGSIPMVEIRDPSVAQLAKVCGCSARHAGRVFRQIYGKSLRTKKAEIRMDQATELLSVGGFTVERVAAMCGYADGQHFRVAFRRHFGVAPTEWSAVQRCDVVTRED